MTFLVRAVLAAALCAFVSSNAFAETNVMFIVDASGSMKKKVGNETRMAAAKSALRQTLGAMPATTRVGLTIYGHRKAKDCGDIELVSPIGSESPGELETRVAALQPRGETPIDGALRHALRSFAAFKGQNNRIVLVTDGIEECRGDPCAAARAVKQAGLDLRVDVVGFTLTAAQRQAVQCVADETGGKYYDAQNAQALSDAMNQVRVAVAAPVEPPAPPPPPAPPNLLSQALGGQLIAAPTLEWAKMINGRDKDYAQVGLNQEAIFGFKDGGTATFSKFEVYVEEAGGGNVKEFELLAADDSPAGPYRSLGKFTLLNMRMMASPYQPFSFAETTARYLKLKILSNYGGSNLGNTYIGQVRLVGTVGATVTPAAATSQVQLPNLLAAAQGGHVVAPADAELAKVLTGAEADYAGVALGGEILFAFKDDKAATFSRFALLISEAGGGNIKEFELSAGDAAGGPFKPLGKFMTQNLRLIQSPYQEFTFPEVTAKQIKMKVLSNYGGSNLGNTYLGQVRLLGTLEK